MEFVKHHLFFIICGAVGLVAVVLTVLGLNSMSAITQDMQQAKSLAQQFSGFRRGPNNIPAINKMAIEVEQVRVSTVEANYKVVLDRALKLSHYEPLLPGVFPTPTANQPFKFADAYRVGMERMLDPLRAGWVSTASDVESAKKTIADEEAERRNRPGAAPADPKAAPGKEADPKAKGGESGVPSDEAARTNPVIRAAVTKAGMLYCYAVPPALQMVNLVKPNDLPPEPGEMWDAQLGYWIQQDVVQSLARVNSAAAEQLVKSGGHPWVGVMPVKELVSIRVSPYVQSDSKSEAKAPASPRGDQAARPTGTTEGYRSANACNPLFDVVQFTVKLVVDARDLARIVDEICKDHFHRPLRIDYVAEEPDTSMIGKIYGSDPTVRVVMDFETCLFADHYVALMPDVVLEELGRKRPEKKPGT